MHRIFGQKEDTEYLDRPGAYLIPICDDKVGVVQTDEGIFLLGGGIEKGETDEMCIVRECLEEIGYTVTVEKHLGSAETYTKHHKIGFLHPIQTYYRGKLLSKTQEPIEADHKLQWMKYDDLKGKMFLEMQEWAVQLAFDDK